MFNVGGSCLRCRRLSFNLLFRRSVSVQTALTGKFGLLEVGLYEADPWSVYHLQ